MLPETIPTGQLPSLPITHRMTFPTGKIGMKLGFLGKEVDCLDTIACKGSIQLLNSLFGMILGDAISLLCYVTKVSPFNHGSMKSGHNCPFTLDQVTMSLPSSDTTPPYL